MVLPPTPPPLPGQVILRETIGPANGTLKSEVDAPGVAGAKLGGTGAALDLDQGEDDEEDLGDFAG